MFSASVASEVSELKISLGFPTTRTFGIRGRRTCSVVPGKGVSTSLIACSYICSRMVRRDSTSPRRFPVPYTWNGPSFGGTSCSPNGQTSVGNLNARASLRAEPGSLSLAEGSDHSTHDDKQYHVSPGSHQDHIVSSLSVLPCNAQIGKSRWQRAPAISAMFRGLLRTDLSSERFLIRIHLPISQSKNLIGG